MNKYQICSQEDLSPTLVSYSSYSYFPKKKLKTQISKFSSRIRQLALLEKLRERLHLGGVSFNVFRRHGFFSMATMVFMRAYDNG